MSERKFCPECGLWKPCSTCSRPTRTLAAVECPDDKPDFEASIAAAVAEERQRLKALVLAFAHNKMHKPWLVELAGIFEALP